MNDEIRFRDSSCVCEGLFLKLVLFTAVLRGLCLYGVWLNTVYQSNALSICCKFDVVIVCRTD